MFSLEHCTYRFQRTDSLFMAHNEQLQNAQPCAKHRGRKRKTNLPRKPGLLDKAALVTGVRREARVTCGQTTEESSLCRGLGAPGMLVDPH